MPVISGGGGAGVLSTRGQYAGSAATVANGARGLVPWTYLGGTHLLDLTDPLNPTVVAGGVYAVAVTVAGTSMTAGGFFQLQLQLDVNNDDAEIDQDSRTATAAQASPNAGASMTYFIPAGGLINVFAKNLDGAASIDFHITTAAVSRLS